MSRFARIAGPLALLALLASCATLQQLAALRRVTFAFAGLSDVRLAGVRITDVATYRSLSVTDVGRIAGAIVSREVPLEMVAHVDARNPQENSVSARLVAVDWALFVNSRRMMTGVLDEPLTIAPGQTSDVPLAVRFDLLQLGGGGARDLFDLARGVAGYGEVQHELRLELSPKIDTSLGPMRYPSPIVLHRPAR